MDEQDKNIYKYAAVLLGILVLFSAFGLAKDKDIEFSRNVFSGLIAGKLSIRQSIDWPKFKALGMDIGAGYKDLTNDKDKSDYENFFIRSFSFNFKKTGAKFRSFTNWRIYSRDTQGVVVAADYPARKQTLLFTIARDKNKKPRLVNLDWRGY